MTLYFYTGITPSGLGSLLGFRKTLRTAMNSFQDPVKII